MEFEVVLEVGVAEVALRGRSSVRTGLRVRAGCVFPELDGIYLVVHVYHSIVTGSS